MEHVLDLVVMGRACRNASNIKNRQPIGQMFVKADFELSEFYQEIVADELNDEADPKKDNQLDKALETVSEELK